MKIIHDEPLRPAHSKRAFVPTMGALHDGHRALIQQARHLVGTEGEVVVSIFVNPTQFGAGEDFDAYPRDLQGDIDFCAREGVDCIYAPSVDGIYGQRAPGRITIDPGPLGDMWEGSNRPGHFAGVLTVVAILLHKVQPDIAVFGEKDYQQLVLIRRMCRELSFGVQIVGVPTVRDHDGLALSSRNVYLDDAERAIAQAIPQAIQASLAQASRGEQAAVVAAQTVLRDAGLTPDYLVVCDEDLGPAPTEGSARLLVAVPVGRTRLIDNCALRIGGDDDN